MKPHLGNHLVEYWSRANNPANPNRRQRLIGEPAEPIAAFFTAPAPGQPINSIGRKRYFVTTFMLAAALFAILTFTLAYGQAAGSPCDPLDRNCDNVLNIVDFQQLANQIGATGVPTPVLDLIDADENGVLDASELGLVAPAVWRTPPSVNRLSTLGGPPRLGYAVDAQGRVFLRWALPISPYSATVQIVRQPAPPSATPVGRPGMGLLASVAPIYDDATALPLLGAHWPTLQTAYTFTLDADGVPQPITLTTVAEMHSYIQAGANPFAGQQLANQDPGVARVLGRGYLDADFTATGVYTYWLRVNGRTLGPLQIDTTQRTRLPAPQNVYAFEGTANVDGAPDSWERQSELRIAHAAVFLTWDAHLQRRQNHPEWHVGFNVFRKECGLSGGNCTDYVRVNETPVFPRALPIEATLPETVTNAAVPGFQLVYGTEMHEFTYYWADHELNTDRLYCYRIAARDLLGQNGQPSAETSESCLRPPDYLPPQTPEIVEVTPVYEGCNSTAIYVRAGDQSTTGAVGYELWRSARATNPWHPQFWARIGQITPDVPHPDYTLQDSNNQAGFAEHDQFWYRLVAFDANGNRSAPSAPRVGTVEDVCAPQPPICAIAAPGQPSVCNRWVLRDDDVVSINLYRKFGQDDLPLLIDRVPVAAWDWASYQDRYLPPHATTFYYEIRAEDEVGHLSGPSPMIARELGSGLGGELATPIITGTVMSFAGGKFQTTLSWTASGGSNLKGFHVYRSDEDERPDSLAEMVQIDTVDIAAPAGTSTAQSYQYVDDDDLAGNEIYWYAVEAFGSFATPVASEPYAVRYAVLGAEGVRVIEPIPLVTEVTVDGVLLQTATDRCCIIYLRSRNGVSNFTQITPIVYSDRYLDSDVRPGDTAFYQALLIDAGRFTGGAMNWSTTSGEIIGASPVVEASIPPLPALPPPNPQPPPAQQPLPPNAPAELRFGANWPVRVRAYDAGSTAADASGDGAVVLEVAPGDQRQVWVQFDHLQIDANGNVLAINPGGGAQVMINPAMTVNFPDRLTYLMNNFQLNPSGATADLLLVFNRGGLTRWQLLSGGPGNPLPPLLTNVTISDRRLRWQHTITPPAANHCGQPASALTHLFAVADSPLLVVPTAAFTWNEGGISFGATCTLYRERFSGLSMVGAPINSDYIRDHRNDYLFQPSYLSPSATYSVTGGLDGTWTQTGNHSYDTAWPYGFQITSNGRSFTFTGGKLGDGLLTDGTLAFSYATTSMNIPTTNFAGSFTELTLGAGGAVYGLLTGDEVRWTTFSIDEPNYYLYIPAATTAFPPALTWTVPKGNPVSGVEGDGIANAGLNARERDLHWALCPTNTGASLQELTFLENALSKLDLYIRRSGVSGRADMIPESEVVGAVAGYETRFTRFAQSWLSNLELASGISGRILLPYPADVEFTFSSLLLTAGCVDKGDVLPVPQTLAYWGVEMTPRALDFRLAALGPTGPVEKLWVLGDYTINNLARVDGAASDPQVQIDVAFNPNGTFHESDLFVQDTVYAVDGFYTVMNALRLSDYNVANPANSEEPAWDPAITIEKPPASVDGFVAVTGGIYFPWFGEATDPNSDQIYLLPSGDYVGFGSRPEAAAPLSDQLPIQFAYDLAYAQAREGSGVNGRWVGVARLEAWDFVVMDLPSSVVVEPQSQALFFGFPAVAGVMQAIDEAHETWGPDATPTATRFANWRDELRISAADSPLTPTIFDDQVADAVALLDDSIDPATYAALLDALDDALDQAIDQKAANQTSEEAVEQWLTDAGMSAGTIAGRIPLLSAAMTNSPLQARWVRGANFATNITDSAGRVIDAERTLLELDGYVKLYLNNVAPSDTATTIPVLLQASMEIDFDPQGSIYVGAKGIQASLLDNETTMDAEMVLYFDDPTGLEGGLTLNNMATDFGTIEKAGAVAGYTVENGQIGLMYVGATLDLDLQFAVIGEINVGGSMLFGRLAPDSPVLQAEYSDLFDDMDTSALAPGEIIKGAYMMVYANNIPFYRWGAGCAGFDIRGGGEVAFWLFARDSDGEVAWGTRLGVNANGEAFCVAALAAAITLQVDNDFGQNNLDLTGDAWAGAGCGMCEPEDWGTLAGFNNDKWCLKCKIDMHFVIPLVGSNTKSEFDADFSCPF